MNFSMQMNSQSGRTRGALQFVRSMALSRPGLMILSVGVVGLGFASSWSWLAAVGAAPIVLAVLPCAAMCALGVCMPMMMGTKKDPLTIDGMVNHSEPQTAALQLTPRPAITLDQQLPIARDRSDLVAAADAHTYSTSSEEGISHA